VTKDRLAELLWDGQPPRTCTGTLESYVSLVRRRLEVSGGRGSALASTAGAYVLDPAQVAVDLHEVRGLLSGQVGGGLEPSVEQALRLAPNALLASEPYAPWAQRERAVFGVEHVRACRRSGELALRQGRPDAAAELARRAIDHDPLSELSWQLLMRALCAAGATVEALSAYAELRRRTIDELGLEPGPDSQRLYLDMLHTGPGTTLRADVTEVRQLLRLLRGALEASSGITLALDDRRLVRHAESLVGVA
jgi:DNA-binding SARP family transcriptional activator